MSKKISLDDIRDAESDLLELKKKYLRQQGWDCDCTISSTWLWHNEKLNVRGADLSTALHIQKFNVA